METIVSVRHNPAMSLYSRSGPENSRMINQAKEATVHELITSFHIDRSTLLVARHTLHHEMSECGEFVIGYLLLE
jgi:hypothetical protein